MRTPEKPEIRTLSALLLPVVLLLTTVVPDCIVPADDDLPPFTFSLSGAFSGDTVAPYGTLTLAFSDPVDDSAEVSLRFSPPATGYYIIMNARSRDTVTVVLTDPLECSARYAIRPDLPIQSKNGAILSPQNDSIIFYIYPCEQEPNGRTDAADSLSGRLFGTISTIADTDMFMLPSDAESVAVTSFGVSTTFFLSQGNSKLTGEREFREHDTLDIPAALSPPVFVSVCSYGKSAGGYYEIIPIRK